MIALITDFSPNDHYVGVLKGVIHQIHPEARIVDLCHGIPPFAVHAGSFILEKSIRFFPPATIFIVVVDPGVGTERKILIAYHGSQIFIAPDNGVLTPILARRDEVEVRAVDADHFFLQKERSTFEARDRMAPVAGQISKGMNWQFMGERCEGYVINDAYFPREAGERQLAGMIVYIDSFGNAVSNIPGERIVDAAKKYGAKTFKAMLAGTEVNELRSHYAGGGGPFMLIGSHGNLEIACDRKPAVQELKIKQDQPVLVQFS